MKRHNKGSEKLHTRILISFFLLVTWGLALEEDSGFKGNLGKEVVSTIMEGKPDVTLLTPTMEMYSCMDCHEEESNQEPRMLTEEHDVIKFEHNKTFKWCLDCHDYEQRDSLHLISGEKIPFTESHKLCGQCHGPKHRDWELGIHGLRTGGWNKPKIMRNCVVCHDPHKPKFPKFKPFPAPKKPHIGQTVQHSAVKEEDDKEKH